MVRVFWILCLGFMIAAGADMKQSIEDLETLRAEYEPRLMQIDGIEGVGFGIREDGKKSLKIYISKPVEEISSRLPEALRRDDVELEFVGKIEAE